MARTPLFAALRRALRRAHAANLTDGAPPPAPSSADGPSRRWILGAAAITPIAIACRPAMRASAQPTVAIVGGGVAGLLCAHRLAQGGVTATLYEASGRTGGRMFTARGKLAEGQLCELGAELIDTEHVTMHALAAELGLALDDRQDDAAGLEAETYYFDGKTHEIAEVVAAFRPLAETMAQQTRAMAASEQVRAQLDDQTLSAYLEDAGLAPTSMLRRLIEVAYATEMGLPPEEQSALNFLQMIDFETLDPFRIFGDSDTRYHTHLGNDAIPGALAERLTDRIALEHVLTRVAGGADGFRLGFATPPGDIEVRADHVVLALPWTLLRTLDLTGLELPEERRTKIAELGYGTNAKLMMQFARRVWKEHGAAGAIFTDDPLQTTWDTTPGQPGTAGVLTNFVGGGRGLTIGEGTAEEQAMAMLPYIDAIYPGTAAAYLPNSALRMHWPSHPWTRGSYSCFRPGQNHWAGALGERIGRLHFAGEHTSAEFSGYMEGAAESGERAAREVLGDLGIAVPPSAAMQRRAARSRRAA
ncbi:MAG: FAD-dependent oxidoreductase [Kofleriaceae bacterium]